MRCRECGCKENAACVVQRRACYWVEPNLCCVCAGARLLRKVGHGRFHGYDDVRRAVAWITCDQQEAIKAQRAAKQRRVVKDLPQQQGRVVDLVCQGKKTREIAMVMRVAESTVSNQLQTIYRKLGVRNRGELVAKIYGAA